MNTSGQVMNRPASAGQHCKIGKSRSEKPSRRITSLHGPDFTVFGKNEPSSASFGSILILSSRPCGCCMSRNERMRSETSSKPVDFQRQMNAPFAPQHVDEQRHARSLRALEEQRRAAGARDAVGDLGDLQHGIHFGGNALEFPFFFQARDELAQVLIGTPSSRPWLAAHGKQPHRLARFTELVLALCTERADGPGARWFRCRSRTCRASESHVHDLSSIPCSNNAAGLR